MCHCCAPHIEPELRGDTGTHALPLPQAVAANVDMEFMLAGYMEQPMAVAGYKLFQKPAYSAASAALPGSDAALSATAWEALAAAGSGAALLDQAALVAAADPLPAPDAADCSTKPRACENCTCGRAEREAADAPMTAKEAVAQSSSCGNVRDAARMPAAWCATRAPHAPACPLLPRSATKVTHSGAQTVRTLACQRSSLETSPWC